MSAPLDMLLALGSGELVLLFWLMIIMDVPRYLLSTFVVAIAPGRYPQGQTSFQVSAVVSCYNEEKTVAACVGALRAAGVEEIVAVDDGSEDDTRLVLPSLGVIVLRNEERQGKPTSVNKALAHCTGDLVVICDADTTLAPEAIATVKPYFLDPDVAGVGLNLRVRNAHVSLITRLQAIEYAVQFTAGRMCSDAFGILPNVSGAGGVFRREAITAVGGLDVEVAEDAALAMKLRRAGWKLRYAGNAYASTNVPEDITGLTLQRLRWDASIITIWLFKFGGMVNPFARNLTGSNLVTSLDVLVFSVVLQLVFPVYVWWIWTKVGATAFVILGAVMLGLAVLDGIIVLLVGLPLRLVPYVPLYIIEQTFVLRPLRVFALAAELAFSITRHDDYVPKAQRWRLT
jgi:cellulose synthase/poly-beta-1,6-N-acetylglucosamine synthase-like glycosyltransferase